jgi:hypothetical protein
LVYICVVTIAVMSAHHFVNMPNRRAQLVAHPVVMMTLDSRPAGRTLDVLFYVIKHPQRQQSQQPNSSAKR